MSKDDTLLREVSGLRVAVEEDLTVKPSATATSTPSLAVTSNGSSSFGTPHSLSRVSTEESAEASLLLTSTNQPIGNYEAIGLSPGSLKAFDEVQDKIDKDGFLDEEFETMSILVFRCIYFLYGEGYAWGETRDNRIEKIRKFVESPNTRDRLRCIACPSAGQLSMLKERALELYCRVALTVEQFFGKKNAKGGFPQDPIVRFQRSANCYTAGAFYSGKKICPSTLKLASRWMLRSWGRRFAFQSDADLERRVLHDRGMPALEFASKLVGREPNASAWKMYDFDGVCPSSKYALFLAAEIEEGGKFGLVTNFHVHEGFEEAAAEELKNVVAAMEIPEVNKSKSRRRFLRKKKEDETDQLALGYRKFDDYTGDTKGEPVCVRYDKKLDEKQEQLRGLWERQLQDTEHKNHERKQKTAQNVPDRWRRTGEATPKSNDPSPGTSGSGKHAMVLLGTYREYK